MGRVKPKLILCDFEGGVLAGETRIAVRPAHRMTAANGGLTPRGHWRCALPILLPRATATAPKPASASRPIHNIWRLQ